MWGTQPRMKCLCLAWPASHMYQLKGRGKAPASWKQHKPHPNQTNKTMSVCGWRLQGNLGTFLTSAGKVSYTGQLSAEFISEFPSLCCFPDFGETEVMKGGSVLAILGKIILVWIYSPQNSHLKMGAWAMSCCSSSEWNLMLVHPVSCSLFFCTKWKTLSLFWEVPWCS